MSNKKENKSFYKKIFDNNFLDNTYGNALEKYTKEEIFKWIKIYNVPNKGACQERDKSLTMLKVLAEIHKIRFEFYLNKISLIDFVSNEENIYYSSLKDQNFNIYKNNISTYIVHFFNWKSFYKNYILSYYESYGIKDNKILEYILWNDILKFFKEHEFTKISDEFVRISDYLSRELNFSENIFIFSDSYNSKNRKNKENTPYLTLLNKKYFEYLEKYNQEETLENKMEKYFNYNDNNSLVLEDLFFGDETFQSIFDVIDSFSGCSSAKIYIPKQPAFNQYNFSKNYDNKSSYSFKVKSLLDNALILNDTYNELRIICDLAWNNNDKNIKKEIDNLFKILLFGNLILDKDNKTPLHLLKYDKEKVFTYSETFDGPNNNPNMQSSKNVPTLIAYDNIDEIIKEYVDSLSDKDRKSFTNKVNERFEECTKIDQYFSLSGLKMLKIIETDPNIFKGDYESAKLSFFKAANYYFYRKFRYVEHKKFNESIFGEKEIINYYLKNSDIIKNEWSSHIWNIHNFDLSEANKFLENNELNWSITRSPYILDFYSWRPRILDFLTKKYLNTVNIPFYDRVYKNDPNKKINLNLSNLVNEPKKLEITIINQLKTNFDLISNKSFKLDEYVKLIMSIVEMQMFENQNYNRLFYYFIANLEIDKDEQVDFVFIDNDINKGVNCNYEYYKQKKQKISKLDYFIYLLSARFILSKQLYWNLFFIVNYCNTYSLGTLKNILDIINKPYITGSKKFGYKLLKINDEDGYYTKYNFWWENVLKMIQLYKFESENDLSTDNKNK